MKVIEEGAGSTKWTTRIICRECQAVLEIEEADLKFVNLAVAYAGETWDPALYVNCYVCSSRLITHDVPSGIRDKMYSAHRQRAR